MDDQAERLRQVVENKSGYDLRSMSDSSSMDIITVTSGKGGVGKTSFAVNFGIALGKRGKRVIILDADFGLSNVDLMLGMRSKYDITDVLYGEKTIHDIMVSGFKGVKFISGGSGLTELINIDSSQVERVVKNLAKLENEADILIVDTGAGVSDIVLKMVNASDETMLIITPEPTSIMDAFAVIKTVVAENRFHNIKLIVNKAETDEEAKAIAENFIDVVKKFLGIRISFLGSVTMDKSVVKSIKKQIPVIIESPSSRAAVQIENIVDDYLNIPRARKKNGNGFSDFIKKLLKGK